MTKNNFPIVKSDAFNGLRALRKLTLDGNNITIIRPFAFRGLPRLRELTIHNTAIDKVAQFAFAGLQNLTLLALTSNKILKVEGYAFAGTASVRTITLKNNPLVRIETNAFSSLTNVERIVLPSGIRKIEPDAFSGLDTVGSIKLMFMDLASLQPFTFRGLINVNLLSLQESDLGTLCGQAFEGMSNVETLNILNNKIDAIHELNISYSHRVKQLKLQGNHLLDTPEPGAITLDGIDQLVVVNNHFPCGCHIHTLLDSPLANGTYQQGDFLRNNFCISPLEVNGRRMSEIDLYSIGRCHEQVTRENLEGSRATSLHRHHHFHSHTFISLLYRQFIAFSYANLLIISLLFLALFYSKYKIKIS